MLVLVTVLLLTGCGTSEPDAAPAATPTADPGPPCAEVSAGMLESIQWGLDEEGSGFLARRAASIPTSDGSGRWLVAAEITGPGVDSGTAVWLSRVDPATARDTAALLSADAVAEEFSVYVRPGGVIVGTDQRDISDASSCMK